MITLTRPLARHVRAVFRHALGTSPRGPFPAVSLRADQHGLTIRSRSGMAAIERSVPGEYPADEIRVPGELLVDCEGRSDQVVSIERQADGDLIAAWQDGGVPVLMRYTPPDAAELADLPGPPEPMADNPSSLLTALRDASETDEPASIRFALDHLELCGDSGTLSATDSRQVLVQTGFRFPWQGKVLVPRSTLYGNKELQPTAVSIAKTEDWLAIRIGAWLYQVKLGKELRFPNVAHHLQSPAGAVARLQIAPADAQFLEQSLPRLPGNDDTYHAITLDMNGQIAIRARGEDQPQPTELLLGQSERIGDPLRISTDRRYLARALRLGFRELLFYAANAPIQCTDETRHYLWAVLEPDSAIKPSAKAIRVASPASEPSTTTARTEGGRAAANAVQPHRAERITNTAKLTMSHARNHPCPKTPPIAKRPPPLSSLPAAKTASSPKRPPTGTWRPWWRARGWPTRPALASPVVTCATLRLLVITRTNSAPQDSRLGRLRAAQLGSFL